MFTVQNIVHSINLREIIYYVSLTGGTYAIRKPRIKEKSVQRHNGSNTGIITSVYRFKDGYTFDTSRLFLPVFQARA